MRLIEQSIRHDDWEGTRDELIKAGFAVDGFFPGDPGRPRLQTIINGQRDYSYVPGVNEGRWVRLTRRRDHFLAEVRVAPAEYDRRLALRERRAASKRATDELQRNLALVPKTIPEARAMMRRAMSVETSLHMVKGLLLASGFTLSSESERAILSAVAEVQEAISDATITLRPAVLKGRIAQIHREVMGEDPGFTSFLSAVSSVDDPSVDQPDRPSA